MIGYKYNHPITQIPLSLTCIVTHRSRKYFLQQISDIQGSIKKLSKKEDILEYTGNSAQEITIRYDVI